MKLFKTTISKSKYVLFALLVAFSFSCSPEDGEDGAPGEQGPAGTDGNANVIYSDWFQPVESDYSVNNSDSKSLPIDLPDYDPEKDALLVYYYDQLGDNPSFSHVYNLPYYKHNFSGESLDKTVTIDIRPNSSLFYVKIKSYGRDLLAREFLWEPDSGNLDNKGVRFRYMIISGNIATRQSNSDSKNSNLKPIDLIKQKLSNVGVDINDYNTVCDYYGIAY
jgi:hypothetical protein